MRTLEALLKEGTGFLREAGIEEAALDAWLLLEFSAGKSRAWFLAHGEEEAGEELCRKYRRLIKTRAERIPLQHLTHQAFFMGHEFYVNENVLIPRQDTEILAEEALKALKEKENPRILDMCTGSGCILLSILAEREDASGVGVDISPKALEVAKRNADSLKTEKRAEFVESDIFCSSFFQQKDGKEQEKYDMLISNPPYIATGELDGLMEEVRLHDPVLALDGREDGLYFYRQITQQAGDFLKPGGMLAYEIGCSQGKEVSALMESAGFDEVKVLQDLAGLDRVVTGRWNKEQETDKIM